MSFPVNSVLDNFNRTNEGPPPSASWIAFNSSFKQFVVAGSAYATPESGSDNLDVGNLWNGATFGPDSEAFATLSLGADIWDQLGVALRGSVTSGQFSGYEAVWTLNGGSPILQVYRWVNNVATQLGADVSRSFTSGYKLGATVTGTGATVTIEVFTDEGSGWVSRFTRDDSDASRITGSGKIGIHAWEHGGVTCRVDDFGGGTITAGAVLAARKLLLGVGA